MTFKLGSKNSCQMTYTPSETLHETTLVT